MSSGSLSYKDAKFFSWEYTLRRENYVLATYYVESAVAPDITAVAMAKEQSATHPQIKSHRVDQKMAARVVNVEVRGETQNAILPQFWLNTQGDQNTEKKDQGYWQAQISIAYPLLNVNSSLSQLCNVVIGDLPRLGFLNTIQLTAIDLPFAFVQHFPGPRLGMEGLRERLGVHNRPLFCRACQPAVGLDLEAMCAINRQVLCGGFDAVKDDELTVSTPSLPYAERIEALVRVAREAEQKTGERKLYFANIIDDISNSFKQLEIAENAGADGVVIAPAIQGLAFAKAITERTELPILAVNSVDDIFCRHPRFGVTPAVYLKLLRLSGADLVFPPGAFATPQANRNEIDDAIQACAGTLYQQRAVCPIIVGGKRPDKLADYMTAIGSPDFMVLAASYVDTHPDGLEAGARAFREAWDEIQKP